MPTTDVTNTLIANITSTEQSTSAVDINRSTGNPAFPSNIAQFTTYNILTGSLVIPLPISPCTQVYIRNIDTTNPVGVIWTGNGAGSGQVCTLYPGDQLILWAVPGKADSGITALTLAPQSTPCSVEYFLGG